MNSRNGWSAPSTQRLEAVIGETFMHKNLRLISQTAADHLLELKGMVSGITTVKRKFRAISKSSIYDYLVLCGVFVVSTLGFVSMMVGSVETDESVFLVLGREMHVGQLPYRDLWDHKAPPIYLVGYVVAFFGDYYLPAGRLLVFAWPLLGVYFLVRAWPIPGNRLLSALILGHSLIVFAATSQGVMTEQLEAGAVLMALAFLFWGLNAGLQSPQKKRVALVIAGIMLGCAIAVRASALIYLVTTLSLLGIRRLSSQSPAGWLDILLLLLGALAAVAAGLLIIVQIKLQDEFYQAYVLGNLAYLQYSSLSLAQIARLMLYTVIPYYVAMYAYFFVTGLDGLGKLFQTSAKGHLLAGFVGAGLIEAISIRHGLYLHYWSPVYWLLAFPSSYAVWCLCHRSHNKKIGLGRTLSTLFLLGLMAIPAARPAIAALVQPPDDVKVARIVQEYSGSNTRLWVAGVRGASLYLHTGLRPAVKFLYTQGAAPIALDPPRVIADLNRHQPIIVAGPAWFDGNTLRSEVPAPISQYIAGNYQMVDTTRGTSFGGAYAIFIPHKR